MLALYREAYKKKSDVLTLNKVTLTQKNVQYEMFKFYKEHLHPLSPIPSLRHMLMWALQSSMYIMGWQFSFNGQLNWNAAEANWRLVMDPLAATNYEIVEAACFVSEHRGGRPGSWADDAYTGVSWADVCMTARDQQDAAEEEEHDVGDDDLEINTQPVDAAEQGAESAYLDLSELAVELDFVVEQHHEDDDPDDDEEPWSPFGTPPGAPPAYRAGEAAALAEEKSDDETTTADAVRPRSRYLDDEAAVAR